jgi:hypothetical protein
VQSEHNVLQPLNLIPLEWLVVLTGPVNPDFLGLFQEQTDQPELIERTILEVAGTLFVAQLTFHYGIASNVAGGDASCTL